MFGGAATRCSCLEGWSLVGRPGLLLLWLLSPPAVPAPGAAGTAPCRAGGGDRPVRSLLAGLLRIGGISCDPIAAPVIDSGSAAIVAASAEARALPRASLLSRSVLAERVQIPGWTLQCYWLQSSGRNELTAVRGSSLRGCSCTRALRRWSRRPTYSPWRVALAALWRVGGPARACVIATLPQDTFLRHHAASDCAFVNTGRPSGAMDCPSGAMCERRRSLPAVTSRSSGPVIGPPRPFLEST